MNSIGFIMSGKVIAKLLILLSVALSANAMQYNPKDLKLLAGQVLAKNITTISNLLIPAECLPLLGLVRLQKAQDDLEVKQNLGKILDSFEYLDVSAIEPNTKSSFEELIKIRENKGIPYILAVVVVPQSDGSFAHYYRDAHSFNKLLWGKDYLTKLRLNRLPTYGKYFGLFGSLPVEDNLLLEDIVSVNYFSIDSISSLEAIFLGTYNSLSYTDRYNYLKNLFLSEEGYDFAQAELGFHYSGSNNKLAKAYYTLAASQGNSFAQYNLGLIYYLEGNIKEAKHYYTLAAGQGNASAQYNLGIIYANEGNIKEAKYSYVLAANQNHSKAQNNLAQIYEQEDDMQRAKYYFTLSSADQGNTIAQYNLGRLYEREGDLKQAKHYYTLAAAQGHSNAQLNLGCIYYKASNIKKAKKNYTLAASQGNAMAQFNLGIIYQEEGDLDQAKYYYTLAANQGLAEARAKLKSLN